MATNGLPERSGSNPRQTPPSEPRGFVSVNGRRHSSETLSQSDATTTSHHRHPGPPNDEDLQPRKPFLCTDDGCNTYFARKADLERHRASRHAVRHLFCGHEGCKHASAETGGFARKDNLEQHLRRMHGGVSGLPASVKAEAPYASSRRPRDPASPRRESHVGREALERDVGRDVRDVVAAAADAAVVNGRKRMRRSPSESSTASTGQDLVAENERLRVTVKMQGEKIEKLERLLVDALLERPEGKK